MDRCDEENGELAKVADYIENLEGWVNEVESMTAAKHKELQESIKLSMLAFVKVSDFLMDGSGA